MRHTENFKSQWESQQDGKRKIRYSGTCTHLMVNAPGFLVVSLCLFGQCFPSIFPYFFATRKGCSHGIIVSQWLVQPGVTGHQSALLLSTRTMRGKQLNSPYATEITFVCGVRPQAILFTPKLKCRRCQPRPLTEDTSPAAACVDYEWLHASLRLRNRCAEILPN